MSTFKHILHSVTIVSTAAVAFFPTLVTDFPAVAHAAPIVASVAAALTYVAHLFGVSTPTDTTTTTNS